MTEKRVSLLKKLVSAVFPRRCAFCGRIVKAGQDVCVSCGKALPYIGMGACPVCGRERKYCRCRKEKFAFERCTAPFYYEGVAKKGVLRLKFCGRREVAKVLAAYLALRVAKEYSGIKFDFVTAVPLSAAEKRRRGYNQAEDLGRALALRLSIPYTEALVKPRDIKPQHSCTSAERERNVVGAFEARSVPKGVAVLLVDDVVTTGATLSECAAELKKAGASSVFCAAAARVK